MRASIAPGCAGWQVCLIVAAIAGVLSGSAAGAGSATWALPAGKPGGDRAATGSVLSAANVRPLQVSWRFPPNDTGAVRPVRLDTADRRRHGLHPGPAQQRLRARPRDRKGAVGQALRCDQRRTERTRARRRPRLRSDGLGCVRAVGSRPGRVLWRRHLTSASQQFVDVAPVLWKGLVFLSTVGFAPLGRGVIYALDARTGAVRWRFETVKHPLAPPVGGGRGRRLVPGVDRCRGAAVRGHLEPHAVGRRPQTAQWRGVPRDLSATRIRWSCSTRAPAGSSGTTRSPPTTSATTTSRRRRSSPRSTARPWCSGRARPGRVIAWNRRTRRRVWSTPVGLHRNDLGPLPRHRGDRLSRPVRGRGDADGVRRRPPLRARRRSLRLGQRGREPEREQHRPRARSRPARRARRGERAHLWDVASPRPIRVRGGRRHVVFTSTYAGTALRARHRHRTDPVDARLPAGINGCPAVAGDMLIIGAGVRERAQDHPQWSRSGSRSDPLIGCQR